MTARPCAAKPLSVVSSGETGYGRGAVILNIQLLRGLAALAVVLVHLTGPGGLVFLPRIGQGGVDVFFVISGFLMVDISRGRRLDPLSFMTQRLARIAPFYWLMTFCVFLIALAAPRLLAATTPSFADLIRSLLFIPYAKPNGLIQPMLFVGWSLNYEIFFYACFALGLLMPRPASGFALTTAFLLACTALAALNLGNSAVYRFYTSPLSLEFLAGMGVAALSPAAPRALPPCLSFGLCLTAVGAFAGLLALPILGTGPMLLLCGVPSIILVWAAVRLERAAWRVRSNFFILLGNASFALYLTHPFVVEAVRGVAERLRLSAGWQPMTFLIAILAAIAFGILSHLIVERPLSRWTSRQIARAVPGESPPRRRPLTTQDSAS